MLAYIFDKNGKPRLTEKEKPSLQAGNGAVIKLEACSICGTDIRTYRFGSNKIPDGRIMGHEIVGQIIEVRDEFKRNPCIHGTCHRVRKLQKLQTGIHEYV